MEEKRLNISEEALKKLSIEEIAELKIEVDDLLSKINSVLETCDEALKY